LLPPGRVVAGLDGVRLAHELSLLRLPVVARPGPPVDARARVHPHLSGRRCGTLASSGRRRDTGPLPGDARSPAPPAAGLGEGHIRVEILLVGGDPIGGDLPLCRGEVELSGADEVVEAVLDLVLDAGIPRLRLER